VLSINNFSQTAVFVLQLGDFLGLFRSDAADQTRSMPETPFLGYGVEAVETSSVHLDPSATISPLILASVTLIAPVILCQKLNHLP
jgi:hypothetical protein